MCPLPRSGGDRKTRAQLHIRGPTSGSFNLDQIAYAVKSVAGKPHHSQKVTVSRPRRRFRTVTGVMRCSKGYRIRSCFHRVAFSAIHNREQTITIFGRIGHDRLQLTTRRLASISLGEFGRINTGSSMKDIPETKNSLVLRTDFSDNSAWESICAAIREPEPEGGFRAYVDCLSDPEYDGLTAEQLTTLIPRGSRAFAFVVDRVALAHPEHPILVVDLFHEPGRTFRVIPSKMQSVQNNLEISNMDFDEFAEDADKDGIFRGFD